MNNTYYGIIKTVGFGDFCDSFSDTYKNNFTYEGKKALYEYLEEYANSLGENIELDTVALCCEYSEYDNELVCASEYGFIPTESETTDLIEKEAEQNEEARLWLEDRTQVIDIEGLTNIIIQDF